MKLILLVGMNKTGSSVIQSTLMQNKKAFVHNGFYIPESKYDERMLKGLISPGNGAKFARLIASRNEEKLFKYMLLLTKKARENSCHSVVLSNEVLIRVFSKQELIDLTNRVICRADLELHLLCVHRNIYNHALSLFKHRAKSGLFYSYESWLKKDYETLNIVKSFLSNKFPNNWNWSHRSYELGIKDVVTDYFVKLGMVDYIKWPDKLINASLSLSELKFISNKEKRYPGIAPYIVENFQNTQKKKSDNYSEMMLFYSSYKEYIKKHNSTLFQWKNLLCEEAQVNLLSEPESLNKTISDDSQFTEDLEANWERVLTVYKKEYMKRKVKKSYHYLKTNLEHIFKLAPYDKHEFGGSL